MFRTLLILGLLTCLSAVSVSADEQKEDETLPSLELLVFLGEWETGNGEWQDPLELERMDLPEQEREKDDTKK